jgi:predicted MPP superfamily phosphohydrolase
MKKYFWYIGVGAVLTVLALWCYNRWDIWFYNLPEPAYTAVQVPSRIVLTFGSCGENTRAVSWQCGDTVAASECLYTKISSGDTLRVEAEGKLFVAAGGRCVLYHAELDSLERGATYSYCVNTAGLSSDWQQFDLNANSDSLFSFVYVGDVQDKADGFSRQLLPEIAERFPTDFWIFAGDLIERPHDQYWNEFFVATQPFRMSVPITSCTGNHDYLKGIERRLEERFIYTFPYFLAEQHDNMAVYAMRYGDAAFIYLDTNRDFWHLYSQRQWLEQALKETQMAKWRIVVMHHPVFSIRHKNNNLLIRKAFQSLFAKYKVDLLLAGHEHAYARKTTRAKDGLQTTPVYVISQCSPKDYRINLQSGYDRYGLGNRFYQIVTIANDTLQFLTFTEKHELYDELLLIKSSDGSVLFEDKGIGMLEILNINLDRIAIDGEKRAKYEQIIQQRLNQ